MECSFPNNLGPSDTVSAITFIQDVEEHIGGDIEVVCVRTLGIKNLDVPEELGNQELPVEVSLSECFSAIAAYSTKHYFFAAVCDGFAVLPTRRSRGARAAALPRSAPSHCVHRRQEGLPSGCSTASFLTMNP